MLRFLQSELNYWFLAYLQSPEGSEDERTCLCMVEWLRGRIEQYAQAAA